MIWSKPRILTMLAIACFIQFFTVVGHVIVLLAGALDAYVAALLGLPRLAYSTRRVVEVVNETQETDQ